MRWFWLLPVGWLLAGCSVLQTPEMDTLSHAVGLHLQPAPAVVLNPQLHYLRIGVDGQWVYAALGNVDDGVQVWYTADGEVLRLREGRVAGAQGMLTEWRQVVLPAMPTWQELAKREVYRWVRVRDVMPGYRYGVHDNLLLQKTAAPRHSALLNTNPASLTWFTETDESGDLPPARYAVDLARNTVMYAETCFARDRCITWQRWQ